jgi:hypothetical protein
MAAKRKGKERKLQHGTKATAKARGAVRLAPEPWDKGADGPAARQRESEVVEGIDPEVDPDTNEVKRRNPNGVKRRVFYDMLDVYYRKGWITRRGYNAGADLRGAWEQTERSGGYLQERVDSTPKPDKAIAMQIDRVSALVSITRRIPREDWRIVVTVACEKNAIGRLPEYRGRNHEAGKAHLYSALERLADRMGY